MITVIELVNNMITINDRSREDETSHRRKATTQSTIAHIKLIVRTQANATVLAFMKEGGYIFECEVVRMIFWFVES